MFDFIKCGGKFKGGYSIYGVTVDHKMMRGFYSMTIDLLISNQGIKFLLS
jgi:hypothetical protein